MITLFKLLSGLPLGVLHALGWLGGWLTFVLSADYRQRLLAQARQAGNHGHDLVEATTDLHLKYLEETLLRVSPIIREAVDAGRLEVVVAKYFLHAGQVQPLTSTF